MMSQVVAGATFTASWNTSATATSASVCAHSLDGVELFSYDDDDAQVTIAASQVTLSVDSTAWSAGYYTLQATILTAGVTTITQHSFRVLPNICPVIP